MSETAKMMKQTDDYAQPSLALINPTNILGKSNTISPEMLIEPSISQMAAFTVNIKASSRIAQNFVDKVAGSDDHRQRNASILDNNKNKQQASLIKTIQKVDRSAVQWDKAAKAGIENQRKLMQTHTRERLNLNPPNKALINKLEERNNHARSLM